MKSFIPFWNANGETLTSNNRLERPGGEACVLHSVLAAPVAQPGR